MDNVELDEDDADVVESAEGNSHDATDSTRLHGIGNEDLRRALYNESSFAKAVEALLGNVLRHYKIADKPRSIQNAMVGVGALKFYRGDFVGAAKDLGHVIRAYADESWTGVEMSLLTTYAHCLKVLNRKQDYCQAVLEIVAKLAEAEREAIKNRTNFHPKKNHLSQDSILQEMGDMDYLSELFVASQSVPSEFRVPIGKVFGDVRLDRYPRHRGDSDGFEMALKIQHLFPEDLRLENVKVKLGSPTGGPPRELWLEDSGGQKIRRGVSQVWLATNITSPGIFNVERIEFTVQNVKFFTDLAGNSATEILPEVSRSTNSIVHFYPDPEAVEVQLRLCRKIHLEKQRAVEVILSSGRNFIVKGELRIRPASAGLRLKLSEAELVDDEISSDCHSARPGGIELKEVPAQSKMRFLVPYLLEQDLAELSLRTEIAYSTAQGEFLSYGQSMVPVNLPLGVNVQDIFKKDKLLSKFSVSAATLVPLRVFRSKLEGSDVFNVEAGRFPQSSMVIFPKQAAQLFYKITQLPESEQAQRSTLAAKSEPLALSIEYNCLDEEIIATAEAEFTAYLSGSAHRSLQRQLLPFLRSRIHARLTPDVLEVAALRGEIDVGTFEDIGWRSMFHSVPAGSRDDLRSHLQKWHKDHSVIDLSRTEPSSLTREITIPVEVPSIHVLHTVNVHVPGFDVIDSSQPQIASVGQMLPAELQITHTRAWDQERGHQQASETSTRDGEYEFTYEIHGNPDCWIIGGRKRAQFAAKADELRTFPVMLIPLRPGHLLLPSIEVAPYTSKRKPTESGSVTDERLDDAKRSSRLSTATTATGGQSSQQLRAGESAADGATAETAPPPPLSCEVDCQSQAQTILVLPDMQSTTVSVDAATPGGAAWLVASEGRTSEVVYVCIDPRLSRSRR